MNCKAMTNQERPNICSMLSNFLKVELWPPRVIFRIYVSIHSFGTFSTYQNGHYIRVFFFLKVSFVFSRQKLYLFINNFNCNVLWEFQTTSVQKLRFVQRYHEAFKNKMQFKVARYTKEPVNMWPLATVLSSLSIRQLPCFPHGLVGGKQDRA